MSTDNSAQRPKLQGKRRYRDSHVNIITRCTQRLVETIDLLGTQLLESLENEGIIGHSQVNRIRETNQTNQGQVAALLRHLMSRDETDFDTFVNCMDQEDHKHVVRMLQDEGYTSQETFPQSVAGPRRFLVLTEFDRNLKGEISMSEQSIVSDLCRLPHTTVFCTRWRPSYDPVCNEKPGTLTWLGYDQALWEHYGGDVGESVSTEIVHASEIRKLPPVSHIVCFLPCTNRAAFFFKKTFFPQAQIHTFVNHSIDECETYFDITTTTQETKREATKRSILKQCEAAISLHPVGLTISEEFREVFEESDKMSLYVPCCSEKIAQKAARTAINHFEKVFLISDNEQDFSSVQDWINEHARTKKVARQLTKMTTRDACIRSSEEPGVLWITTVHTTDVYKQYFPVFNVQPALLSSQCELARLIRMACDGDKYKGLVWERSREEDDDRKSLSDCLSGWFSKDSTSDDLGTLMRSFILEFYFNPRIFDTHLKFLKRCTDSATLTVYLSQEDGTNLNVEESRIRHFLEQLLPDCWRYDSETKKLLPLRKEVLLTNRENEIIERLRKIMPHLISVSEGSLVFEKVCGSKEDYKVLYTSTSSLMLPSVLSQCFMLIGPRPLQLPTLCSAVMSCSLKPPFSEFGGDLKITYYFDGEYQGMRGIHRAAECGASDVVAEYAKSKENLNLKNMNGETALIVASIKGHADVIEVLLKLGADTNIANENGKTALMMASTYCHAEITETLLNHGADPNVPDTDGVTALMDASRLGHRDVCEILLTHEADPNVADKDGGTAITVASWKGRADVCETLLLHGAKPNVADKDGGTALMVASWKGCVDVCEVLLQHKADPDAADKDGGTALMVASWKGRADICQTLLEYGADTNLADKNGVTALMSPSTDDFSEISEKLLTHGARPNDVDNDGKTALMVASRFGFANVCKTLLKNEADPNVPDKNGATALMFASNAGFLEICKTLLTKGADPNIVSKHGVTALMGASRQGHSEVCKFLLTHGADPNISDKNGVTALMAASGNGFLEICDSLLLHRADPNLADKVGQTALMYASKYGRAAVAKKLLQSRATPNIADKSGHTPLIIASLGGHVQVAENLLKHGADPNIVAENGETALTIAFFNDNDQLCKTLRKHGAKFPHKIGDPTSDSWYTGKSLTEVIMGLHLEDKTTFSEGGED